MDGLKVDQVTFIRTIKNPEQTNGGEASLHCRQPTGFLIDKHRICPNLSCEADGRFLAGIQFGNVLDRGGGLYPQP